MVAPRKAAFAEESAEVEVLFANMDKLKGLTKKIQGSLNRLENSGKSVQDAIGPVYGNTQRLQTTNTNVDKVIAAIDRILAPLDQRNREDGIIRAGLGQVDLEAYIDSLDRTTQALRNMRNSNLKSNQNAIEDLNKLLKAGMKELDNAFRDILREDARPVEPLHYITKDIPFPALSSEKSSKLRKINSHITASITLVSNGEVRETPTLRAYAEVRGDYMAKTLRNLAAASVSTARKTTADAIYRQGTCAIGTYAQGMEGIFIAEYDNVCPIFSREEWGAVYSATCLSALSEFTKTLRDLDAQVKNTLITDCYLAYEIVDIVSKLSINLETKTGELKRPIADSVKPVRDTAKMSLSKLLEDTRDRVQSLIALPMDGGAVPATTDVMTRLQTMTLYLSPISSIMTSLGEGGWNTASAAASSTSIPTLKSFDVGADGTKLFASYATDTLDALLQSLELKARQLLKGRSLQGVFISNNVAVIDRMIRQSELQPLLGAVASRIETWRKKGTQMYLEAWREPAQFLLDTQYTNRGARPTSGGGIDSAAFVKALSSKDKDSTKEKFRNFNTSFDELVRLHKSYKMEKEVRAQLTRDVTAQIEPLYNRFWDRYHEVDRGKGKYVKYDKSQLAAALAGLA